MSKNNNTQESTTNDGYKTIYLHSNFTIKYMVICCEEINQNCRRIYLYYEKNPDDTHCWTLLEDNEMGNCGPHFMLTEVFQLIEVAFQNKANFQNRGSLSELQIKKQIIFLFLHIYGRTISPALYQKIKDLFKIDLYEKGQIWKEYMYEATFVLKMNHEIDINLDKPTLVPVDKPMIAGKTLLELTSTPEYLENVDWINSTDYDIQIEDRYLQKFKPREGDFIRYNPPEDTFILRKSGEREIECIFPANRTEKLMPLVKKQVQLIHPEYKILYADFDYTSEEIPLGFITNAIQVKINPGFNYQVLGDIYKADGLLWEKNEEHGFIMIDNILNIDYVISIRHHNSSLKPSYTKIKQLLSVCKYDFIEEK